MDASDKPFPLGNPQVKHIIFRFISGGAGPIIAALQNGEIDMVPGNVGGLSTSNAPDIDKVTADGTYKVIWNTGYSWEHVDLNTTKAPMDDPAVRNALFYAVDKKSIIDKLYNGKNQAVDLPGPTTAQNSWGYTDNYTKHDFNLDKAKQVLKDDGWDCSAFPCTKKGADGKPEQLKFVLMTTTRSDRIQLAQVLQQQWKAIGADANLTFMESRNYFASGGNGPLSAGTYDAGIYTWSGLDDPQFYQTYGCFQVPNKANGFAGQNYPRWCNKDADAALKASEATTNTLSHDLRKPFIEKFFQAFATDVPVIPLYAATEPLVYRAGLTNFKPGLTSASVATWNTWEWTLSK
jgi:peptide/nickel transport system substrate-binding protein